jgi:hypothetical protein
MPSQKHSASYAQTPFRLIRYGGCIADASCDKQYLALPIEGALRMKEERAPDVDYGT